MIKNDGVVHNPMEGIRLWKNPKNRFLVFEAHYTADPEKRTEAFREEKKASLPLRKFLMEYELQWDSFSGLPVFGDTWNRKVHARDGEIMPEPGLPLLLGLDFGLTPACVVAQYVDRQFRCLKEFVAVNMGAERFISLIIRELIPLYPSWNNLSKDYIVFIDPSGMFRKDTDENTCAKIIDQKGFKKIIPGAIPFEERRTSVELFLQRMSAGEPCFQLSTTHCPMLLKGFNGGYSFKEGQEEIEPNKLQPLKNEYSHPHDALQMITSRILGMTSRVSTTIPKPGYNWMR